MASWVAVVAPEMVPVAQSGLAKVFGGAPSRAGVMGDALQPLFTTDLPC